MEYTKAITFRVKEQDYNMLSAIAETEEMTISNLVRKYVVKPLRKEYNSNERLGEV